MQKNINEKNVQRLLEKKSSKIMLLQAFSLIKPEKKEYISAIIIGMLCGIPALIIGISTDTIPILTKVFEMITGVMLTLLGVVFTGYAFFQALVSQELLVWLINEGDENRSKLEENNEYFIKLMMLQGISVFIGLFLGIIFIAIPSDWSLFGSVMVNNSIACVLVWIYLVFNFLVLWELKSFIFNVFQLFNAHAVAKILSTLNKKDND